MAAVFVEVEIFNSNHTWKGRNEMGSRIVRGCDGWVLGVLSHGGCWNLTASKGLEKLLSVLLHRDTWKVETKTCTHMHSHTHTHACMYAQTHTYTYTQTHLHTLPLSHTHTYTHTQAYLFLCGLVWSYKKEKKCTHFFFFFNSRYCLSVHVFHSVSLFSYVIVYVLSVCISQVFFLCVCFFSIIYILESCDQSLKLWQCDDDQGPSKFVYCIDVDVNGKDLYCLRYVSYFKKEKRSVHYNKLIFCIPE